MAKAALTVGAVLDTVVVTANVVTKTVSSLGEGADMLHAFAVKKRKEQAAADEVHDRVYKYTVAREAAEALARENERLEGLRKDSPEFKHHFDQAYGEFADLLGLDVNKDPYKGVNKRSKLQAAE